MQRTGSVPPSDRWRAGGQDWWWIRVRWGLALCLMVFGGCTTGLKQWKQQGFKVGPDYVSPPVPISPQWIDEQDPRVDVASSWEGAWWSVFQDPILDGLIDTASRQNLPLQEAGFRILEARSRLAVARGDLFPQVQEAFGTYSRVQLSRTLARPVRFPFFDDWTTGLSTSWELDFWGRFRRSIEASEATYEAAIQDSQDALVMLQAEVARAYIEIRVAQERIRLAEQNVAFQKQTLAIAELRFREGQTTRLDELQARDILATTQSVVPQLENSLRESQNALCVRLGMPPHDLQAELATAPIPEPPVEVAVGVPAELLSRRPDVHQAERQVAAQSARIGIAEAELYPRIALTSALADPTRCLPIARNLVTFSAG